MLCPGCGTPVAGRQGLAGHANQHPACRPAIDAAVPHGTTWSYLKGCRCRPCTDANTATVRYHRHQRRLRRIRGTVVAVVCDHLDTYGPDTAATIAARAGIDPKTTARTLHRLRHQGIVTGTPDPDDQRPGKPRLIWRLTVDTDTWLAEVG